jgi:hypothetical protein
MCKFFASEKQGKSHNWWTKKIRNLNDHALENGALVSEKEWVSQQTHLGLDTSRPLVFNSNLKSYVATHLIDAICAQSQASYV